MAKKDTYKYELHDGHKTVYVGTTIDPERREEEHRASGKEFTKMTIIGRPSTAASGKKSELTPTSETTVAKDRSTIRMTLASNLIISWGVLLQQHSFNMPPLVPSPRINHVTSTII